MTHNVYAPGEYDFGATAVWLNSLPPIIPSVEYVTPTRDSSDARPTLRVLVAAAAIAVALFHSFSCNSQVAPSADYVAEVDTTNGVAISADEPESAALKSPDGPQSANPATIRLEAMYPMSPDPLVVEPPAVFLSSLDLIREIHAGLMTVAGDPNELVAPALAQAYEVNSDFTLFTFRLREGLKFSDGAPLTASDVKWSWERALKHGGVAVENVLGSILGATEILEGNATDLAGVNVVDAENFHVTMVAPDPYFLARVANPVAHILQPANARLWIPRDFDQEVYFRLHQTPAVLPVGAGPFRVRWVRTNGTYELEPNPHYFDGPPDIANVEFDPNDWHIDEIERFGSGNLDAFWLGDFYEGYPVQNIAPASHDGSVLFTWQPDRLNYLVFNDAKPPFDDLDLRKALAAALNRYETVDFRHENATIRRVAADARLAEQHLAASTYADSIASFNPIFYTRLLGTFDWLFDEVAVAWSKFVGMPIRMWQTGYDAFSQTADAGEIDFVIHQAVEEFPAAASILEQVVAQLQLIAHGSAVARIVEMMEQARATVDPVRRERNYHAVSEALIDQALVIPLDWWHTRSAYFVRHGVHGFDVPQYGGSRLVDVSRSR